jgi:hypothetical protein
VGVHDEEERHVEAAQQCQLPQYVVVVTIRMPEAVLHMAGARLPVILLLPKPAEVAEHVLGAAAAAGSTKIEAACQHRVGVGRLHNVQLRPRPLQIAASTVLPLPRLPAVAGSPSLAEVALMRLSLRHVVPDVWIVAVAVVIDLAVVEGVDRVLFERVGSEGTVVLHRLLATTVDEVADGTELPDGLELAGVVAVAVAVAVAVVVVLVAVLVVVLGLVIVKAATVSVLLYHPIGP